MSLHYLLLDMILFIIIYPTSFILLITIISISIIIFNKQLNASVVTEENFHELVQVTSTGKNGGSSLVEALRQVWAPTLKSSGVDASSLKKLEEDILGPRPSTSIEEEELFWHRKSKDVKKSDERKLYQQATSFLKKIRVELESAAVSKLVMHSHQCNHLRFCLCRWIIKSRISNIDIKFQRRSCWSG